MPIAFDSGFKSESELEFEYEPLYSKEGSHQTMILLQESYGESFSSRSWEGWCTSLNFVESPNNQLRIIKGREGITLNGVVG
jgi:hypothetical protein